MMTVQSRKYHNYIHFIRRLLLLGSIWPSKKNQNKLYNSLPIVIVLCFIAMGYAMIKFCFENLTNLSVVTKGISLLGSFTAVVLKVVIFAVHREKLRELNGILDVLMEEVLEVEEYRPHLHSLLRSFYYPAYVQAFLIMGVFASYVITPSAALITQLVKKVSPLHCILPFPASFPWTVEGCGLMYQVHYAFELLCGWVVFTVTSGVDSIFGQYILQIATILRVLSIKIQKVEVVENSRESVIEVIDKHRKLLRSCEILESVYGPIVFWMTITGALMMCAIVFQGFQTKMTIGKAILFVFYIFMKLAQIYFYSWYGTIITVESETFRDSVYCSNWPQINSNWFNRSVLMIISQKPMRLMALNFFGVSVDLFITVLNTTMSYFFLLKTLDATDQ